MKKDKGYFFVMEYKENPKHYYQDSYCSSAQHKKARYCLSTADVLEAKRFTSEKEAWKNMSKKKFNICKVEVLVHRV